MYVFDHEPRERWSNERDCRPAYRSRLLRECQWLVKHEAPLSRDRIQAEFVRTPRNQLALGQVFEELSFERIVVEGPRAVLEIQADPPILLEEVIATSSDVDSLAQITSG